MEALPALPVSGHLSDFHLKKSCAKAFSGLKDLKIKLYLMLSDAKISC